MKQNQNNTWVQVPNRTTSGNSVDQYGAQKAVSLNPQGRDSADYNTDERNKLMQCNKTGYNTYKKRLFRIHTEYKHATQDNT